MSDGSDVVEAMVEEYYGIGPEDTKYGMASDEMRRVLRAALEAVDLDHRAVEAITANLNMTACKKVTATNRARNGLARLLAAAKEPTDE